MMNSIPLLKIFLWVILILFGLLIFWAMGQNSLLEEFSVLWPYPWMKITLADLYIGFTLVGLWIIYRENSIIRGLPWLIALYLLGNLVTLAYLLWSSRNIRSVSELDKLFQRKIL